jgi:YggT family protein
MSTLIIGKLNLFLYGLYTTAMIFVVALVIARVVAGYADLNFFGWTYVTLRRLTDPLVAPVRRALAGFRVDPKYAPLVTILIIILLWWLAGRATDSVLGTIAGVTAAVQQQAISHVIGHLLLGLLQLYTLLIFVRIVLSWVMPSYSNRVMRFLVNATEPLLGPLRRLIPPVGMFDISAFVAFVLLYLVEVVIQGAFMRS